ncbi:hypothetical protein BKG82_26340 [Mycobacteroides chelonae]|uniref:Uncharacterized protein n=2 Tax=Mycobacteroides chelonae TaxID=1774 RepID=A0A1S1LHB1_MYCCH|nr:hypothetical protein BKG82_26340 [Mycobacteroides chelonae]
MFSGEIGIPFAVNRSGGQPVVMWDVLGAVDGRVAQRCLDGDVSGATSLAVLADNEADFAARAVVDAMGRAALPAGFSHEELMRWHEQVRKDGRWLF